MTSPYQILGIEKEAGDDEVKKAFRRLSMRYHPDRNKEDPLATVKFQEINSAYQNLINIKKFEQKVEEQHVYKNTDEIIDNLNCQEKPEAIIETIDISLEKAFTGCNEPIEIKRYITTYKSNVKHLSYETETIYIPIQKGVDNNELIILKDKGNVNEYNISGDIKIFILVVNNTKLTRKGLDLYYLKTISLKEALCGFSFNLDYLDNKIFKINNNSNILVPGSQKIIHKLGMIRGECRGNLIIDFNIEFPKYIDKKNIEILEKIL
tara:strand:- start:3764 stop:4558 length:795 start_codon:yes stop_codon:yes gene_type:complete